MSVRYTATVHCDACRAEVRRLPHVDTRPIPDTREVAVVFGDAPDVELGIGTRPVLCGLCALAALGRAGA